MSKSANVNNPYIRNASLWVGQALMLVAVLFLFVEGCSQAPEQYKRGNPPTAAPRVEGLESDVVTAMLDSQVLQGFTSSVDIETGMASSAEVKEDDQQGNSEESDRRRDDVAIATENSKKPVIFGVGAAGITFKTEFDQARKILAKPDGSQSGPNADLYDYREGMAIIWRKLPPKTPLQMLVGKEYLGEVVIGGRFGNKKLGANFGEFLKEDSRSGWEQLMVEVYNALEKKPADYSCAAENVCALSSNDQFIAFNYPKGALQFSKDRKEFFGVMLSKHTEVGKLDNDFDLISGQIVAGDERMGLGDSWKSFSQKVTAEADTSVLTNQISKRYNGVSVAFEKRAYDRDTNEPAEDAFVRSIVVGVPYEKFIKVNNKYVEVTRNGTNYSFALKDKPAPGKAYLNTNLAIGFKESEAQKPNQLVNELRSNFMKSLLAFVEHEVQLQYPKAKIITYLSGQHSVKSRKELLGKIRIVFPDNGGGQSIAMALNPVSGDITTFAVTRFDSALDKRLSNDFVSVYDPAQSQSEIGGIKLRSLVNLTEIDNGRTEATAEFEIEGVSEKIKSRVKYARTAAISTPFQAKKLVPKKVHIMEYEKFGVALVLEPTEKTAETLNDYSKSGEFMITSVQLSHLNGVKNLCGLGSGLKFSVGDKATDVKKALDEAIKTAKEKDPSFDCRYMVSETNDGLRQPAVIFFPDDNLAINFKGQELDGIRIY